MTSEVGVNKPTAPVALVPLTDRLKSGAAVPHWAMASAPVNAAVEETCGESVPTVPELPTPVAAATTPLVAVSVPTVPVAAVPVIAISPCASSAPAVLEAALPVTAICVCGMTDPVVAAASPPDTDSENVETTLPVSLVAPTPVAATVTSPPPPAGRNKYRIGI